MKMSFKYTVFPLEEFLIIAVLFFLYQPKLLCKIHLYIYDESEEDPQRNLGNLSIKLCSNILKSELHMYMYTSLQNIYLNPITFDRFSNFIWLTKKHTYFQYK